jgi:hypothetical protein
MEITGHEQRSDGKENVIKVQANNAFADKLLGITPGDIVSFICELEGRIWNKSEDKKLVFQNLVVKEYRIISSVMQDAPYTGNPKKADVDDQFPSTPPPDNESAASKFNYDDDLPF